MVDVVDSIVAELIVRDVDKYEAGFDRATKAHERFLASTGKLQRQTFDLGAEGRKYKAGVDKMAQAQEQSDQRITRSRKKRTADSRASDEAEVASAKKAAREKVQAAEDAARRAAAAEKRYYSQGPKIFEAKAKEIKARNDAARAATAEANATAAAAKKAADAEVAAATRIRAAAERAVAGRSIPQGSAAFRAGRTVPREGLGMAPAAGGAETVASAAAAATGAATAEKEVNHLLADQAALQSRLTGARGKDRDIIREQLAELRLIGQLQRAGLRDEEIALRLEQRRAAVQRQNARASRASLLAGTQDSRVGTAAGVVGALGVGVSIAAVQSALDYGKALKNLSDQLGITTDDLQAYMKMARDAGVSQEQLSSAFGQFASNLGRAQQGQQEQAKVFKALGINIKEFASAGDALPTVIDRISQIKDPANRAAIETRLFGEEGRKLDPLLSQGAEGVSALAQSLLATGQALSSQEIKQLNDTAQKLAAVKAELQVDLSQVVAQNAGAIEFLVSKFARLADIVLKSVTALRIFANQDLSFQEKGKQLALLTPQGRNEYLRQNERQQDELRARIGKPGPRSRLIDRGRDVSNDPKLIAAQDTQYQNSLRQRLRQLANDHRDVRTGADGVQVTNPTPAVQPGRISLPAISRLGAPAGPKGKSAQQLEKEADQRQRRADDELFRVSEDYLQAQRQITASAERRYEIDKALTGAAYQHRLKEIDREVTEKQIDASRAKGLKAAEKLAYEENLAVLALQNRVRIESDANALRQQMLDAEAEMLSAQEQLADSSSERKEIAARRLAAERRAETASLNAIINSADPSVSEGDRSLARDRLGSQDTRFGAQAARDARANESPLEAYRRNLNRTPGQITDSVESYVVEELDAVHDAITGAIQKAIGVKDPLLQGLLDLLIDQVVMKPLLAALDKAKGEGGGGLGGFIQGIASLFGGSKVGGTRAAGGNIVAGVPYLVGEHGPEPVVFGASGKVFPNGALPSIGARGGAMALHQTVNIDASGVNPAGYTASILGIVRRETSAAIQQSGRAVLAATPARMQKLSDLGS